MYGPRIAAVRAQLVVPVVLLLLLIINNPQMFVCWWGFNQAVRRCHGGNMYMFQFFPVGRFVWAKNRLCFVYPCRGMLQTGI